MNYSVKNLFPCKSVRPDGSVVVSKSSQKDLVVFKQSTARLSFFNEVIINNAKTCAAKNVIRMIGTTVENMEILVCLTHDCDIIFINVNNPENTFTLRINRTGYDTIRVNVNQVYLLTVNKVVSIRIQKHKTIDGFFHIEKPVDLGVRFPNTLGVFSFGYRVFYDGHNVVCGRHKLKCSDLPLFTAQIHLRFLVVYESNGTLTLWDVPSETIRCTWSGVEQIYIDVTQRWLLINDKTSYNIF